MVLRLTPFAPAKSSLKLGRTRPGIRARVYLISYPNEMFDGTVEGTGWAEHRSRSTNRQQAARRLIKPEEVLQGLRYDEQIVLIQNAPPLRCGRAIYFRRPEMVARMTDAPVRMVSRPWTDEQRMHVDVQRVKDVRRADVRYGW